MANAWMTHVKQTMRKHPGKKLKDVLKLAAKTYKKSPKVGKKKGRTHRRRTHSRRRKHKRRHRRRKGSKSKGRRSRGRRSRRR